MGCRLTSDSQSLVCEAASQSDKREHYQMRRVPLNRFESAHVSALKRQGENLAHRQALKDKESGIWGAWTYDALTFDANDDLWFEPREYKAVAGKPEAEERTKPSFGSLGSAKPMAVFR